MAECDAARRSLRLMVGRQLRILKAHRFKPHTPDGKRHLAFKDLREFESTLRSADRHMARLRQEEAAILQRAGVAASSGWSEFAAPARVKHGA